MLPSRKPSGAGTVRRDALTRNKQVSRATLILERHHNAAARTDLLGRWGLTVLAVIRGPTIPLLLRARFRRLLLMLAMLLREGGDICVGLIDLRRDDHRRWRRRMLPMIVLLRQRGAGDEREGQGAALKH